MLDIEPIILGVDFSETAMSFKTNIAKATPVTTRIKELARELAARHKIPVADILSEKLIQPAPLCRQEIYHTIRREMPMVSFPDIGRFMGRVCGRSKPWDHTTIVWGVRRHQSRLDGVYIVKLGFRYRAAEARGVAV